MTEKNAVFWITGASSGIGKALAEAVYARGGRVILSARREEKLRELSRGWEAERVLLLPLDLGDHDGLAAAAERAFLRWERLDVLINNAGISQRAQAADTDYPIMKTLMDVNFLGSAWLTRCVLPYMLRQGGGIVAAVGSVAGKFGTPLRSSYSASKMALQGYYDSLRAEVFSQGIQVSLIVPGFVKTPISENALKGSGLRYGRMDPNQAAGISPERAAALILAGLARKKREILLGISPKLRLALFLNRFLPGLLARTLRSARVV